MSRDTYDIERMAEAAHNAWLAEKQARGVTTWPNERGFEQMVPYADCPDDIKEFDRIVVAAIAAAMPSCHGYACAHRCDECLC